jgi:DNA-binding LacI/PurR family transcriptional regulator
LLEFDYERTMDRSFKAQLADSGIVVKRILCKFDDESHWTLLADVRRIGHRAVAEYFSSESRRRNPPDAVLFDDDYLGDGGLVALYEAGLRVPEDVKVVFYSNKGNEPVLGVSAARIENDPASYGDAVAQYVLKLLSGRKAAPPKVVRRFIPGKCL